MKKANAVVYLTVLLITGCAALGLQPAQSVDERLAYAYATRTAVVETAASAVTAGSVSVADGLQVKALADQAKSLLEGARALSTAGDTAGANAKLTLAVAVIEQLKAYLQAKGVK